MQRVWVDNSGRLILKLRKPGFGCYLILSALPGRAGFGVAEERPASPPRPPMLAAYLRAHLEGGKLLNVTPRPFERFASFHFTTAQNPLTILLDGVSKPPRLAVLSGEGKLVSADRWDGKEGIVRPGAPYPYPEIPKGKLLPSEIDLPLLAQWHSEGVDPFGRILGLPSNLPRPTSAKPQEASAYLAEIIALYKSSAPLVEWGDGLAVSGEGVGEELEVLGRAGAWLLEEGAKAEEDAKGAEEGRWRKKLLRRIANIRADLEKLPDPELLRQYADALGAVLYRVRRGDSAVAVDSFEGGERVVTLDPALEPGENLQKFYLAAKKATRAREISETRLKEAEELLSGEPQPKQAAPAKSREKEAKALPFRRYRSSDGWTILVGRNRQENDELLREAKPWDLWFHARGGSGAHVLLKMPGREAKVPDRTLAEAAGLAASHSALSGEKYVEVAYLPAARVNKPKGAGPGQVLIQGEKTLRTAPGAGNPRLAGRG